MVNEFAKMMAPKPHRAPVTLATALGLQKRPNQPNHHQEVHTIASAEQTAKLLNAGSSQVQLEP